MFNLAIDYLAVKPYDVYFNEFVANVLRDNIGIIGGIHLHLLVFPFNSRIGVLVEPSFAND